MDTVEGQNWGQVRIRDISLADGENLDHVMKVQGRAMQQPGSWTRRLWPSWEISPVGLKRAKDAELKKLIE